MRDEFASRVRAHFAGYDSTIALVDTLIHSKANPQEIIILICSRLDAIANSSGPEEESQQRKFVRFITNYSGRSSFFKSISLGDLYYEIGYHRWLLPGLIPKAGRLHYFSDVDREIAIFLDDSNVELTDESADRLLYKIQACLSAHFRVRWKQSLKKQLYASPNRTIETLIKHIRGIPQDVKNRIPAAIKPLLLTKTCAAILYRRFRSEAIHGGAVRVDEAKFFKEKNPYWKPLFSEYYGSFLLLEFPAIFLQQLLTDCLNTYERYILARRKVPPSIHFEIFPDDVLSHLDWLDEDLLPAGQNIRLNIPRR